MFAVPKTALLLAFLLAACDSGPVVNDEIVIDLHGSFSDTLVQVEVDGERVFRDRVTTGAVLATAGGVTVPVAAGVHRIRATVEDRVSGEVAVDSRTVVAVGVGYRPDTDEVTLLPSTHPFFHR